MRPYGVTIQMKATEQYFPVVLFVMLYKAVLTFKSVDEILKCEHSNESYWAVLSCGTVYYAIQVVLTFKPVDEILRCDHSNESYWAVLSCGTVYYAIQVVLTLEPVDEILRWDHSNKSYLAVLSVTWYYQFSHNLQNEIWPLELTDILLWYLLSMRLSIKPHAMVSCSTEDTFLFKCVGRLPSCCRQ